MKVVSDPNQQKLPGALGAQATPNATPGQGMIGIVKRSPDAAADQPAVVAPRKVERAFGRALH